MDSFFGFDTTFSVVNNKEDVDAGDGKRSRSSSCYFKEEESDEEEYDALNDETFGAADKGDWEHIHENLVRLESGANEEDDAMSSELDDGHSQPLLFDDYDLDLKFNFYDTNDESGRSSVGAQSFGDEFASKLRLDPSIWDSPLTVATHHLHHQPVAAGFPQTAAIHPSVSSAFQNSSPTPGQPLVSSGMANGGFPPGLVTPPMKMLSVEDIERNIIQQQRQKLKEHQQKLLHQQRQQQQQQQQQKLQQQHKLFAQQQQAVLRNQRKHQQTHAAKSRETLPIPKDGPLKMQHGVGVLPSVMNPLGSVIPPPMLNPPQLLSTRNALFPSVPGHSHSAAHLLTQTGRVPLGMVPHPYGLLSAAGQFPGPINNLAMHPAFPHAALGSHGLHGLLAGSGPIPSLGQQRHPVAPSQFLLQPNASSMQNNQFNQRLVQEIQQNHPLLAFNRHQQQLAGTFNGNSNGNNNNSHTQKHHAGQYMHHHQQQYRNSNGIPHRVDSGVDHDEYANLMSNREKQWLIGIQLTQLNSDWPYFSDYYFTVFKERLAALKGESHAANRAYKDNQLNHPFTQPTGHAQLLLMSSMAKSAGMLHVRERKSSESKSTAGGYSNGVDGKESVRMYTPLQFENSLGKLQCGSVTAPRKIIDMEVMGGEERDANGNGINLEHSLSQRKTRHLLLLIETLYRIVLKLEDLLNPTAIEAFMLLREKRLRERHHQTVDGGNDGGRGTLAELPEHTETYDELVAALIGSLSQDKTTSILGVRKGKILLRRSLAVLRNHPFRWTLWAMIFNSIPLLQRKDRDDVDGLLFSLYTEFERHVQCGTVADLLRLSKTFGPSSGCDAVTQYLTTNKLLLSAVITIIFQMEILYGKHPRPIDTEEDVSSWLAFLLHANRMVCNRGIPKTNGGGAPAHGCIRISPDNNIVRTLRVHFDRFSDRAIGSDLLNFITDNGNDGN